MPIIRYTIPIIDWILPELDMFDNKTRKLMTMKHISHQSDADKLCLSEVKVEGIIPNKANSEGREIVS